MLDAAAATIRDLVVDEVNRFPVACWQRNARRVPEGNLCALPLCRVLLTLIGRQIFPAEI